MMPMGNLSPFKFFVHRHQVRLEPSNITTAVLSLILQCLLLLRRNILQDIHAAGGESLPYTSMVQYP